MPMFNNLLESKPKKQRSLGGTIFSLVLHVAVITLAVFGTAKAKQEFEKPKEEKVDFAEVKPEEPPPPEDQPPPPEQPVAPPPPKGFQVLTAPVNIPDVIPDVDITKEVTNEEDFTGKGVQGGVARGVVGGTGVVSDQPYFEFQVEKQPIAAPGNPKPRFPEILQNAGVEGQVLVQFVIDTTGRADMRTLKILKSDHDLFTSSIRSVLPSMRFFPGEIGGRKVKVVVQMPFEFALGGGE